ncbi:MAG: hypothetical protein ACLGHT_06745, partial [Acidimicrobiia bacterium]
MTLGAACGGEEPREAASAPTPDEEASTEEGGGLVNSCAPGAPEESTALEGEAPAEGATMIDVTAIDHEFEGLAPTYAAGDYGFRLTNKGKEAHEFA